LAIAGQDIAGRLPPFKHGAPQSPQFPYASAGLRGMIGAGTIINPIVKVVTTVIILGAVYLFFVKPALDTTNNAFEEFGLDNLSETFEGLPTDIQERVDSALEGTGRNEAAKLGDCITRVQPDTEKIQRCAERFGS
jgi:hypothetical protein